MGVWCVACCCEDASEGRTFVDAARPLVVTSHNASERRFLVQSPALDRGNVPQIHLFPKPASGF